MTFTIAPGIWPPFVAAAHGFYVRNADNSSSPAAFARAAQRSETIADHKRHI